jgi:hypothetical protein
VSMLPLGFFIGGCTLKWCENLVILGSEVAKTRLPAKKPAYDR